MTRTFKCYIFFLSDCTTRPSDLPLNVIVRSGNSQAVKAKVVLQMAPPLLGDLRQKENRPRPLPLTPMLNPFVFTKQSSQCIFYGFREGSPLHVVSLVGDVKAYTNHIQLPR